MLREELRKRINAGTLRNPLVSIKTKKSPDQEYFLTEETEKFSGYCRLEGIKRQGISLRKKKR